MFVLPDQSFWRQLRLSSKSTLPLFDSIFAVALTLLACRSWGLAAAQRLLGRAARGRNAAMLAMMAHHTVPGRSQQWLKEAVAGVQDGVGRQVESACGSAAQWSPPAQRSPPTLETLLPIQHRFTVSST